MKLEKLSALAELVSAVAIVVTLGYLAVQTRQNTTAVQAAVRQSMLVEDRELLFKTMEFPFFAAGEYNGRELTRDEEVRLISYLIAFVRTRENEWLQYQNGVIDEATWATYRVPMQIILSQPFSRHWWEVRAQAGEFVEGFINDVNELLAEMPIQSATSFSEALGLE